MTRILGSMQSIRYDTRRSPSCAEVCIAAHEAGHAVTALHMGVGVSRVTVEASGGSLGQCAHDLGVTPPTQAEGILLWASRLAIITLGGIRAPQLLEAAIRNTGITATHSTTDHEDLQRAYEALTGPAASDVPELAAKFGGRREHERLADRILNQHDRELDRLTIALLRYGTLNREDIKYFAPNASTHWERKVVQLSALLPAA